MKQEITVRVRRGDKLVKEDAVLWTGEVPPEYLPGQNRKMKSRRYKREGQEQRLLALRALLPSPVVRRSRERADV